MLLSIEDVRHKSNGIGSFFGREWFKPDLKAVPGQVLKENPDG